MPWNQSKYEEAKAIVAKGADSGETPETLTALSKRIDEYENDRARGQNPAPRDEGRTPQPAISVSHAAAEVPQSGPKGMWVPQRPLGAKDFIPDELGGGLTMYRDMPFEAWKQKVLLPAQQSAIAAGEKAKFELQRYPTGWSQQDFMARVQTIAEAEAAQRAMIPDDDEQAQHFRTLLSEVGTDPQQAAQMKAGLAIWDSYKAHNDALWQQAVQQRQQDPNAGPLQRLEKVDTSTFAGKATKFFGERTEDLKAAGQGLLSTVTMGLSKEMPKSMVEQGFYATQAMAPPGMLAANGQKMPPVPERDEAWHDRPAANPLATMAGAGIGAFLPGSAGGMLAKTAFGAAAPLGRYGAAAASGAVTSAAEGAVGDVVSGETEDMGKKALARAGVGAGAGLLGQGVTDLGAATARAVSRSAIRAPGDRTPFEFAEEQGYDFGPLGIRKPQMVKDKAELTRQTGVPWAEDFAARARPGFVENVDRFHVAEKAAMGHENLAYFKSVKGELTPLTNTMRAASDLVEELRGANPQLAAQVKRLVYGFDPVMTPQKMGTAMEALSGAVEKATDGPTVKALGRLQAAMMEDMKALPKGNLEGRLAEGPNGETLEGWPALRAEHGVRREAIDEARQLSRAQDEGATLPDQVAALNNNLMNQGKRNFPVAKERVLDRFMPPELKRESLTLRAANMIGTLGDSRPGGPYPSRAGVIDFMRGKALTTGYGYGRAVSKPVPDNYPISDDMFRWLNSRMPRASLFLPGMNPAQALQTIQEMQGRPKRWGDLTPEQQQLLTSIVGDQPESQAGASP